MDINSLLVIFFNQAYFNAIIVLFRIRSCNTSCHSNKSYIRRLLCTFTSHFNKLQRRHACSTMAFVGVSWVGFFLVFTAAPYLVSSQNLTESASSELEKILVSPQRDSKITKRMLAGRVS